MKELLQEIPDILKYIIGLVFTGVGGWFAHKSVRKKTNVETDGIQLENTAKIRKLREDELKQLLDKIDELELEIETYKKHHAFDISLMQVKEKELNEAKSELHKAKRELTKALILQSRLNIKN